MKHILLKLAALAALANPFVAGASVLTFDDLPGDDYFTSTYQGFNFGNNDPQTNPWFHTNQPTPFYPPHSGATYVGVDYQLYPGNTPLAPTQAITSTTAFVFNGAWFTGANTIAYSLYNGAALVYTSLSASGPLNGTPQFVASGYDGLVTGVVILGMQGYYAMDDFTFNVIAASTDVPEPATPALVLAGLLALGITARQRRTPVRNK